MSELRFGYATDLGLVRRVNQDRGFGDGALFAVADGMGGHTGGEVASDLAIESLTRRDQLETVADLVAIIHQANDRIVDAARDDPSLRGMGTTISVLARLADVDGEKRLGIANVGDSRVYRLDDRKLRQLTEDHSLVEALVRDGRLTPEEAGRHPQRNILTRALGIDAKVLVDAWELRAATGDRFLLCTDGLFNELTIGEMHEVVSESADPQEAADRLVERACQAGGRDNVTAVVVDVTEGDALEPDTDRVVGVRRAVPDADSYRSDAIVGPGSDDAEADTDTEADEGSGEETASDDAAGPPTTGDRRRRRPGWRLTLLATAVVVVLVLIVTAVAAYARTSYFVGVQGAEVVIYRGRPGGVLWFDPTVEEPVNLGLAELSDTDFDDVRAGVEFDGIDDAREFGRRLAVQVRTGG